MKKNHQFNVCLAGNNCLGTNRKNNEQKLPKNHVVANKMKATVLYYSHKGKTAFFARERAMYLWSKGLNVSLSAISDFNTQKLNETDFLISGCWTCGWFVVGQHPHKKWSACSLQMAGRISPHRTLLFTTYKFRTGSMYRKMKSTASGNHHHERPRYSGLLPPHARLRKPYILTYQRRRKTHLGEIPPAYAAGHQEPDRCRSRSHHCQRP